MEFLSITGQVAARLRRDLAESRWSRTMPGISRLAKELGVSRKTVQGALDQLEREGVLEGVLENQGRGRNRRIVGPASRPMRVWFVDQEMPVGCN